MMRETLHNSLQQALIEKGYTPPLSPEEVLTVSGLQSNALALKKTFDLAIAEVSPEQKAELTEAIDTVIVTYNSLQAIFDTLQDTPNAASTQSPQQLLREAEGLQFTLYDTVQKIIEQTTVPRIDSVALPEVAPVAQTVSESPAEAVPVEPDAQPTETLPEQLLTDTYKVDERTDRANEEVSPVETLAEKSERIITANIEAISTLADVREQYKSLQEKLATYQGDSELERLEAAFTAALDQAQDLKYATAQVGEGRILTGAFRVEQLEQNVDRFTGAVAEAMSKLTELMNLEATKSTAAILEPSSPNPDTLEPSDSVTEVLQDKVVHDTEVAPQGAMQSETLPVGQTTEESGPQDSSQLVEAVIPNAETVAGTVYDLYKANSPDAFRRESDDSYKSMKEITADIRAVLRTHGYSRKQIKSFISEQVTPRYDTVFGLQERRQSEVGEAKEETKRAIRTEYRALREAVAAVLNGPKADNTDTAQAEAVLAETEPVTPAVLTSTETVALSESVEVPETEVVRVTDTPSAETSTAPITAEQASARPDLPVLDDAFDQDTSESSFRGEARKIEALTEEIKALGDFAFATLFREDIKNLEEQRSVVESLLAESATHEKDFSFISKITRQQTRLMELRNRLQKKVQVFAEAQTQATEVSQADSSQATPETPAPEIASQSDSADTVVTAEAVAVQTSTDEVRVEDNLMAQSTAAEAAVPVNVSRADAAETGPEFIQSTPEVEANAAKDALPADPTTPETSSTEASAENVELLRKAGAVIRYYTDLAKAIEVIGLPWTSELATAQKLAEELQDAVAAAQTREEKQELIRAFQEQLLEAASVGFKNEAGEIEDGWKIVREQGGKVLLFKADGLEQREVLISQLRPESGETAAVDSTEIPEAPTPLPSVEVLDVDVDASLDEYRTKVGRVGLYKDELTKSAKEIFNSVDDFSKTSVDAEAVKTRKVEALDELGAAGSWEDLATKEVKFSDVPVVDARPVEEQEKAKSTYREAIRKLRAERSGTLEGGKRVGGYQAEKEAYHQALAEYHKNRGMGSRIKNSLSKVFRGKEVALPEEILALQTAYRTKRQAYAASLKAALEARGEALPGNKSFSLETNQSKEAFARKFILKPRTEAVTREAEATLDRKKSSRLARVMGKLKQHPRATRAVGLALAATLGTVAGGVAGGAMGIGRFIASTTIGGLAAEKTFRGMQGRVDAAEANRQQAEEYALNTFTLDTLDSLESYLLKTDVDSEVAAARQKAAAAGAASLFGITTSVGVGLGLEANAAASANSYVSEYGDIPTADAPAAASILPADSLAGTESIVTEALPTSHTVVPGDTLWEIMQEKYQDTLLKDLTPQQQEAALKQLFETAKANPLLRETIGLRDVNNLDLIYPEQELNLTAMSAELKDIVDAGELKTETLPVRPATGALPVINANDPLGEFIKIKDDTPWKPITQAELQAASTDSSLGNNVSDPLGEFIKNVDDKPFVPPTAEELQAASTRSALEYNPAEGGPRPYSTDGNYLGLPDYEDYVLDHMGTWPQVEAFIERTVDRVEGPQTELQKLLGTPRIYDRLAPMTMGQIEQMTKTPGAIEQYASTYNINENVLRQWLSNYGELKNSGLPFSEKTNFGDLHSRVAIESYISNLYKK